MPSVHIETKDLVRGMATQRYKPRHQKCFRRFFSMTFLIILHNLHTSLFNILKRGRNVQFILTLKIT